MGLRSLARERIDLQAGHLPLPEKTPHHNIEGKTAVLILKHSVRKVLSLVNPLQVKNYSTMTNLVLTESFRFVLAVCALCAGAAASSGQCACENQRKPVLLLHRKIQNFDL